MKGKPIIFKNSLFLLLLSVMIHSCITRLDFFGDTQAGQLVIYGFLSDDEESNFVEVSRTNSSGFLPLPVENAVVYVVNSAAEKVRLFHQGNGKYKGTGLVGIPGQRYELEVLIDGEVYTSTMETMPRNVADDKLTLEISLEPISFGADQPFLIAIAETTIPSSEENIFLRWETSETYRWERIWIPCSLCPPVPPCFISDRIDPNRINLFSNTSSQPSSISQIVGRRRLDNSFIGIFYVNLKQISMTSEAFVYWSQINAMVNNQGSIFDTPPAPIPGNISNTSDPSEVVLGYFEVSRVAITRAYLTPGEVPYYFNRPCEFIVGRPADDYALECQQCAVRAGRKSWTTTAPEWWLKD